MIPSILVTKFINTIESTPPLKDTNIFFRCEEQDIKNSINMKNASSEEVFAKLRELKDNF